MITHDTFDTNVCHRKMLIISPFCCFKIALCITISRCLTVFLFGITQGCIHIFGTIILDDIAFVAFPPLFDTIHFCDVTIVTGQRYTIAIAGLRKRSRIAFVIDCRGFAFFIFEFCIADGSGFAFLGDNFTFVTISMMLGIGTCLSIGCIAFARGRNRFTRRSRFVAFGVLRARFVGKRSALADFSGIFPAAYWCGVFIAFVCRRLFNGFTCRSRFVAFGVLRARFVGKRSAFADFPGIFAIAYWCRIFIAFVCRRLSNGVTRRSRFVAFRILRARFVGKRSAFAYFSSIFAIAYWCRVFITIVWISNGFTRCSRFVAFGVLWAGIVGEFSAFADSPCIFTIAYWRCVFITFRNIG